LKIEEIWKLMTEKERERWLYSNGFWTGLAKHPSLKRIPHSVKKSLELNASKLESVLQKQTEMDE
jgi:hypothetical protein